MIRSTEIAHLILQNYLQEGDWVIDATVGNGHDTLFLAGCVGQRGRVFGFDVQLEAIEKTEKRVAGLRQVTLINAGHENMSYHLPASAEGQIAGVMFNLGYLPGGDKSIITTHDTTLDALSQSADLIRPGAVITVVLYPGHAGGACEAGAVESYIASLPEDFAVSRYQRIDADAAPKLIAIKKRA